MMKLLKRYENFVIPGFWKQTTEKLAMTRIFVGLSLFNLLRDKTYSDLIEKGKSRWYQRLQQNNFQTNSVFRTYLTKGSISCPYGRNTCTWFVKFVYRGKMWPRDPKFGSLYRGFCYYNGARYIGFFAHTNYCNVAMSKNNTPLNGVFVISGFHCTERMLWQI